MQVRVILPEGTSNWGHQEVEVPANNSYDEKVKGDCCCSYFTWCKINNNGCGDTNPHLSNHVCRDEGEETPWIREEQGASGKWRSQELNGKENNFSLFHKTISICLVKNLHICTFYCSYSESIHHIHTYPLPQAIKLIRQLIRLMYFVPRLFMQFNSKLCIICKCILIELVVFIYLFLCLQVIFEMAVRILLKIGM